MPTLVSVDKVEGNKVYYTYHDAGNMNLSGVSKFEAGRYLSFDSISGQWREDDRFNLLHIHNRDLQSVEMSGMHPTEVFEEERALMVKPSEPLSEKGNMYLIKVKTLFGINPTLPFWLVEKLRNRMLKDGWGMNNIYQSADGYEMQVEKMGSIPVLLIIPLIKGLLALIGLVIIGYIVKNLTDASEVASEIQSSVSDVLDYAKSAGLTPEETQELIDAVNGTYKDTTKTDGGFLKSLSSTAIITIGAILVMSMANKK